MKNRGKGLAFLLAAAQVLGMLGSACGEAVTLAELKVQAPQRLEMAVTTDGGETVTVDAPVLLPSADAMPIVQAEYMLMDTTRLREKYPLEQGMPSYVRIADAAYNFAGSPVISYYVGSASAIDGKTDYSTRAVLAPGETPPESDWTLDQIVQLVYARITEFGGDPTVDLRVYRANAMSGLYRMKMVPFENKEAGVSFPMPDIDRDQPIKKQSKGIWDVRLTQYFHNIPVFPTCYRASGEGDDGWPYPVMGYLRVLDESNMSMLFSCCVETGVIREDTALAPFAQVERAIRERIRSGQLQSVYQVELGYMVRLAKGDSFLVEPESSFNTNARFVLTPLWQICGYDLKDRDRRYFQGFTAPSEQEIMQSLDGDFQLWLDAATAQPITGYEYDREANGQ